MRRVTLASVIVLAFASITSASLSGVVHGHFQRQARGVVEGIERDRRRLEDRDAGILDVGLENEETLYYMNVTIGTPPQPLSLQISTASSDMWVNVASSSFCGGSSGRACARGGTYAPNSSSTYRYLDSDFALRYEDGTAASGDYVTDVVAFAGIELPAQQFGVGYTSSNADGVLGIGFVDNEASYQPYANVAWSLAKNGLVRANAYSLWLNDLNAATGSILFGGVDAAKYQPPLQTLPVIRNRLGQYTFFDVALTAIGANGTLGSFIDSTNLTARLDSATSLTYLPERIAQSVWRSVGATPSQQEEGVAEIACDLTGTIDFTFSTITIRVPLSELTLKYSYDRKGKPVCIFGIASADAASSTLVTLGDTFLRSAYVVFNLETHEVSLAQTLFNASAPADIKVISSTGGLDAVGSTSASGTSTATSRAGASAATPFVSMFGTNLGLAVVVAGAVIGSL